MKAINYVSGGPELAELYAAICNLEEAQGERKRAAAWHRIPDLSDSHWTRRFEDTKGRGDREANAAQVIAQRREALVAYEAGRLARLVPDCKLAAAQERVRLAMQALRKIDGKFNGDRRAMVLANNSVVAQAMIEEQLEVLPEESRELSRLTFDALNQTFARPAQRIRETKGQEAVLVHVCEKGGKTTVGTSCFAVGFRPIEFSEFPGADAWVEQTLASRRLSEAASQLYDAQRYADRALGDFRTDAKGHVNEAQYQRRLVAAVDAGRGIDQAEIEAQDRRRIEYESARQQALAAVNDMDTLVSEVMTLLPLAIEEAIAFENMLAYKPQPYSFEDNLRRVLMLNCMAADWVLHHAKACRTIWQEQVNDDITEHKGAEALKARHKSLSKFWE